MAAGGVFPLSFGREQSVQKRVGRRLSAEVTAIDAMLLEFRNYRAISAIRSPISPVRP